MSFDVSTPEGRQRVEEAVAREFMAELDPATCSAEEFERVLLTIPPDDEIKI